MRFAFRQCRLEWDNIKDFLKARRGFTVGLIGTWTSTTLLADEGANKNVNDWTSQALNMWPRYGCVSFEFEQVAVEQLDAAKVEPRI